MQEVGVVETHLYYEVALYLMPLLMRPSNEFIEGACISKWKAADAGHFK